MELAFERMRSAKANSKGDFRSWLKDFLIFTKTSNLDPEELMVDLDQTWSCMKSEESYLRCKDKATAILKYAIQSYTYFNYEDPGILTNVKKLGLDYEHICDVFDMNFFNFENKKLVLYAFTESLDKACHNLNLRREASWRPGGDGLPRPPIQTYEIMRRFYAIYFANLSQKEEDFIMKGDPKTRFTELYLKLVNSKLTERGNKSLIIDPKLYDILDASRSSKIKGLLDTGEKPTEEDFYEAMLILDPLESSRKKDNPKLLWTSGDGSFSLYKAEKGEYSYLANNETGVVLKVFPTTDKRLVIPEIKKIIDTN